MSTSQRLMTVSARHPRPSTHHRVFARTNPIPGPCSPSQLIGFDPCCTSQYAISTPFDTACMLPAHPSTPLYLPLARAAGEGVGGRGPQCRERGPGAEGRADIRDAMIQAVIERPSALGERIMAYTLAQRFARFAAGLRYDDLPPAVVDKAKACILHCLGVGLAGHASGAVRAARAAILAEEP